MDASIFLIECHSIVFGKKKEYPRNILKECVREIVIMDMKTGTIVMHEHVNSCISYDSLRPIYKQTFDYCRRHLHGLEFHPRSNLNCRDVVSRIVAMFPPNTIFLYKGGTLEKYLLTQTDHYALNIEDWNVPKVKLLDRSLVNSCHYHEISGSCPTQKLSDFRQFI